MVTVRDGVQTVHMSSGGAGVHDMFSGVHNIPQVLITYLCLAAAIPVVCTPAVYC